MSDEVVSWVDADGGVTVLPVEWKARGRFMTKVSVRSDKVPGQSGERPREVRHEAHEFLLPFFWTSVSDGALRTELRQLVDKMNPANDDNTPRYGKVRVQSPLGDVREINCLYTAGLEMDEDLDGSSGQTWQKMPVSFTAYDPYWYDPSPVGKTFALTQVPKFFPIFPLRLTASQLAVDDTVVNNGSVVAWPVWTITGPGTGIKLVNTTTQQSLLFLASFALGAGEVLTVDTRPGAKTVLLQDGTDMFEQLDPVSSLWSFRKGANAIRLEMSAITVASSLTVNYYQRYLSP